MRIVVLRNIEAERVRSGLSKEALSEQLGITSKTYLSWIRGTTEIPSGKLKLMSQKWGVTIEYLLELSGDEPKEPKAG